MAEGFYGAADFVGALEEDEDVAGVWHGDGLLGEGGDLIPDGDFPRGAGLAVALWLAVGAVEDFYGVGAASCGEFLDGGDVGGEVVCL